MKPERLPMRRLAMAGVILAAGHGTRLGCRPKAALQVGGGSLLERLAAALRTNAVEPLSVVLGPYTDTLLPLAARAGLHPLLHDQPYSTLLDSQRLALTNHLDHNPDSDLLLVLGDLPLLDGDLLQPLLGAWRQRPAHVEAMMPVVAGTRGHPVLLSSRAVQCIVQAQQWAGIRAWLADHPQCIQPFITPTRAYVADLDTPADLVLIQEALGPVTWPAPWNT